MQNIQNQQSTINIAVCDDDRSIVAEVRENITDYFKRSSDYIARVIPFCSGDELLAAGVRFDIVFLDIEMQGTGGIETARQMKSANDNCIIIFMTSHTSYVSDSFRVGAFQFLQKPLSREEFDIDLSRAVDAYRKLHDSLLVSGVGERVSLKYGEIFYIESMMRKLTVHTESGRYEYYESLKNISQKLNMYYFYQTHKSFIVNMDKIRIIKKDRIVLTNGAEVFLSKNYRAEFIAAYAEYMEKRAI